MEQAIVVRYSEIHLKGLNRPYFERKLDEGVRDALEGFDARVVHDQGRIFVYGVSDGQMDEACERLTKVFGVHSISPAYVVAKEWEAVKEAAALLVEAEMAEGKRTFKSFARRSDKAFPMNSDAINREMGHDMLERFPELSVDIHDPEIRLCVEIRARAFVYAKELEGPGGMPRGTAGRAMLLVSGGIDSPVAGYMMARRGLTLSAVHFYSYPYTSERALDKVVDLTKIVAKYAGEIRLHLVPFTDIQLTIYDKCPEKETTVIMRRLMMEIAERIAKADGARALITGEAIGQVASQTLESLCVTDDAVSMPVFRPLIAFDKEDIVNVAKRIGTFETSILPYEDCCTVFVPQHPVTKPDVGKLRASEALVDFAPLIDKAVEDAELRRIS